MTIEVKCSGIITITIDKFCTAINIKKAKSFYANKLSDEVNAVLLKAVNDARYLGHDSSQI